MGEEHSIKTTGEDSCRLEIISHSQAQTAELGKSLGALARAGDLILLDGQLGAGKTALTQGLARGLGITDVVNSPTFTILKEYSRGPDVAGPLMFDRPDALYHFDLYRLEEPEEIVDLGFEDYFYGSGVCVVEWADKAGALWPEERLDIQLKILEETKRKLLFVATGERYCELLRQFQKNTYAITRT